MRHAILLGPLACVVLTLGCQTAPDPSLMRQRIAVTKSWHLAYSSRLEPGDTPSSRETSTWRATQAPRNGGIVKMTSKALKQKYGVALTEDSSAVSGEIRLIMTESLDGTLEFIDVALYDVSKQLITRVRVWNNTEETIYTMRSSRLYSLVFNESFADDIAGKTADLLRGNGTVTQ
ncbi:MAG: hypothetical protein Q8P51_00670 [Ignavibacteria bacterium]|nr:hypothetical protein [Ignavibacteria bacterium]